MTVYILRQTLLFSFDHRIIDIMLYIITLRIQALLLVESHDLLEDRRAELRHQNLIQ
jgi:hypothetical protein